MATRKLEVVITGDDRSLSRSLGRSEKKMSKFGAVAKKAGLGLAAGLGAGAVFAVKEAREAEKIGRQTDAVLKSTGGAAKVTRKEIEGLAESISMKAGIDDEAIQSAENLLLTFTKVRNETGKGKDVFNQATRSIIDMSVSLDQDFKSSAIQVGKALNDPVKGLTALQRVGVAFTQDQKDMVTGWVEQGKTLKAQKFILHELKTEFGGSAAAQADSIDKLKVAFGNLAEKLGTRLLPYIQKGSDHLIKFVRQIQNGKGAGGQFRDVVEKIAKGFADVVKKVAPVVASIAKFVGKHPALQKVAGAIIAVGLAVKGIKFVGALSGVDKLLGGFRSIAQTKAGQRAVEAISAPLSGLWGRMKGAVSDAISRMVGAFGVGGGRAGNTAVSKIGPPITAASAKGGKLSGIFRGAGIALGVVMAAEIGSQVLKELTGLDPDVLKGPGRDLSGAHGGSHSGGSPLDPRNWQGGGRIPGAPAASDSVLARLSPQEFVVTGGGERILENMTFPGVLNWLQGAQPPHFAKGGRVAAGRYASTSYGPPWGGIQGMGVTKAGVDLRGSPHIFGIAVDPNRISLGSSVSVSPNPFGTREPFKAFDTGGAILGNRIDFYDWRGRGKQLGWGRRDVNVSAASSRRRGGTQVEIRQPRITRAARGFASPLVEGAFGEGFAAGQEGRGLRGLLGSVFEASAVPAGDLPRRVTRDIAGRGGGNRGGGSRGGEGGRRVGFMKRRAEAISAKHYPYSTPGNRGFGIAGPMDCSGAVSKVLGPSLLPSVQASPYFLSWGEAGKGKHITTYSRGGYGASGHVFMEINGRGFGTSGSNPGGGAGWFTPDESYKSGFTARHPKGFRRGGRVRRDALARLPAKWRKNPRVLAELQAHGVMPGLRRGGRTKGRRRKPSMRDLLTRLPGAVRGAPAANVLRALPPALRGASYRGLAGAGQQIKAQLRKAAKGGLTGQERIVGRRLRGALSLVAGEQGRRVGAPLRASDLAQERIGRAESRLPDELMLAGIDPESAEGIGAQRTLAGSSVATLTSRRGALGAALRRAKKAGKTGIAREIQAEINEVDDQVLGLRASLVSLDESVKSGLQEAMEENNRLLEEATRSRAEHTAQLKRIEQLTTRQGPALVAAVVAMVNGSIGGKVGLGVQSPGFAGSGSLARY